MGNNILEPNKFAVQYIICNAINIKIKDVGQNNNICNRAFYYILLFNLIKI